MRFELTTSALARLRSTPDSSGVPSENQSKFMTYSGPTTSIDFAKVAAKSDILI